MKGLLRLLRLVPVYSAGIRLVIFLGLALLLSACGSGGGNGGNNGGDRGSSKAYLDEMSLSTGSFDQIFQAKQTSYTATVPFPVSSLEVTAVAGDADFVIKINGETVESGTPKRIDLVVGENSINIRVTAGDSETARTYDLAITRKTAAQFAQQAYIKASNVDEHDHFGSSVALSGNTLAVGAFGEHSDATGVSSDGSGEDNNDAHNAGAVYVFTRDGAGSWSQEAYIKASNADRRDEFGCSVALDGDTLAVGACNEASNSTGVSSDGSGEDNNDAHNAGAVYVFTRDGAGSWSQEAYVKASNTGEKDLFGTSVALDGGILAVGATGEDSPPVGGSSDGQGAVYVFSRNGVGAWSQEDYIKASKGNEGDQFGTSLALDDGTLAVGAHGEGSNATGVNGDESNNIAGFSGAVYVFTSDGAGAWSQKAYVKASNTEPGDQFGWSVALDGDTMAVGARNEGSNATGVSSDGSGEGDNSGYYSGAVYLFTRDEVGAWSQQAYVKASNTGWYDKFGWSLALAGDTLAVGTFREESNAMGVSSDGTGEGDNSAFYAGAVYVFTRDGAGVWSQQAYVKASNTGEKDLFGTSVSMDGDTLAVGAPGEASNATGVSIDGTGEGDNSANGAGAVYIRR